jgi:hypothetical protein
MSLMDWPEAEHRKPPPVFPPRSIQNLLERIEATRLLRAELHEASKPPDAASDDDIEALVEHQLAPWRNVPVQHSSLMSAFQALNRQSWTVFIVRIRGRNISVWNKLAFWYGGSRRAERKQQNRHTAYRLAMYRTLLQEVIERYGIDADMVIALDVDDRGAQRADLPVFAFHKHESSHNILVPDIDFFRMHWYTWLRDQHGYDEKAIKATFAGSSTGRIVTEQVIAERTLPRLRSASYFVGSPLVDFRITKAVQCENQAAAVLLQQQPYFGFWMSWEEQLRYRFLLSVDGNGAAWSRLAIALKSNSAVVKYRSPFMLYYFPAMVSGRDYIEVADDNEVEDVINAELQSPGRFRPVAEAGRAFAARYLNKASVLDYTASLLTGYARLYQEWAR